MAQTEPNARRSTFRSKLIRITALFTLILAEHNPPQIFHLAEQML
jgi:hypothetical protein